MTQFHPAQSLPRSTGTGSLRSWTWPVGEGRARNQDLFEVLLGSASWHSETAVRDFISEDRHVLLQAAISVGTASELLLKALIAKEAAPLLAARGDRASVLLLLGHTSASGRNPLEFKSITGNESLEICRELARELIPTSPTNRFLPFIVRNSAAHMALVDVAQLREATALHCRLAVGVLEHLKVSSSDFWGENNVETVLALAEESFNQTNALVRAKISAAQARLNRRLEGLSETERARVTTALSSRAPSFSVSWPGSRSKQYDATIECPACEQTAHLICEAEQGEIERDDEGYYYAEVVAYPFAFECPTCGLALEDDELSVLDGFLEEMPLDPDYDIDFGPDEDLLRDR